MAKFEESNKNIVTGEHLFHGTVDQAPCGIHHACHKLTMAMLDS